MASGRSAYNPAMPDPMIAAASDVLDGSWRPCARSSPAADPRGPGLASGPDTNSIAVLAVHSMHSTRTWLSVATGAPLPERDRPSEFLATAVGVDELLGFFDSMASECRALLDTPDPFDAGAVRPTGRDSDGDGHGSLCAVACPGACPRTRRARAAHRAAVGDGPRPLRAEIV